MASDHYLVRSTIRLKLKRAPVTKSTTKRFDTQKLQNHDIHRRFTIELKNRFQALAVEEQMTDGEEQENRVERKSEIMEKAYVKTAEEVLGYTRKRKTSLGLRPKESQKTEANRCKIRETKTEMEGLIPTKAYGS